MSNTLDFIGFTSLRFRRQAYEELLPKLQVALAQEYQLKGVTSEPRIFLHRQMPDTIIVENVVLAESNIPQTYPKLYVDPLCGAAILRGSHIFASGVIGLEPSVLSQDTSTTTVTVSVFACLGKFNAGFKRLYSGEVRFLGNGHLLIPARQLLGDIHANCGVAVTMVQPLCVCPSFQSELFQSGCLVAQNLPSLVCARVLDARPGELVLDMCSAPGGKCLHLADLMRQSGILIAIDKSAKRLQSLTDTATRLGISCAATTTTVNGDSSERFLRAYCHDSCRLCDPAGSDAADPSSRPPFRPGQFDRILLDAPCSALGQRPRLVSITGQCQKDLKTLDSFPPLQKRLIRVAAQLVKPGGIIVYSTCTTRPEENEAQVRWAVENLPNLQLAEQQPNLRPLEVVPNCPRVQQFLSAGGGSPTDHSDPCDWDTIGFFIAKFVAL